MYKSLHKDLLVPRDFVIPSGPDWAKDLWDLMLGSTVNTIRNVGTYSECRAELEEIGFGFGLRRGKR